MALTSSGVISTLHHVSLAAASGNSSSRCRVAAPALFVIQKSIQPLLQMPADLLGIASELRNQIYELLLLDEEPICLEFHYLERAKVSLGILRVNKAIQFEAGSFFYGRNCFDLTSCTSGEVASFLHQIGPYNANHIRHIRIDLPTLFDLQPGNVTLHDDSSSIFASIQRCCTNLNTLTGSLHSTNAMENRLDALDHPKIVTEALKLIDTCFRANKSLKKIVVEGYEEGPNRQIRKEMQEHGWEIKGIPKLEYEDSWDRNSISDYDGDYGYDHDFSGDDYDIDNDSDFWRRAGD